MSIKKQGRHDADPSATCLSDLVKGDVHVEAPNGGTHGDPGREPKGMFWPWMQGPQSFRMGTADTTVKLPRENLDDHSPLHGDWGQNGNRTGE